MRPPIMKVPTSHKQYKRAVDKLLKQMTMPELLERLALTAEQLDARCKFDKVDWNRRVEECIEANKDHYSREEILEALNEFFPKSWRKPERFSMKGASHLTPKHEDELPARLREFISMHDELEALKKKYAETQGRLAYDLGEKKIAIEWKGGKIIESNGATLKIIEDNIEFVL